MVMGTAVSFLVDSPHQSDEKLESALREACAELHRVDDRFSRWRPESELSRIRAGETADMSDLMDEVYQLCELACRATQGYFDPWKLPGGFDPTGLVKGWAAERALAALADGGVTAALINAGGDVCVLPGRTYLVGVRHPEIQDALCAVVPTDSCIATSGLYERGDHLVNPHGGDVAAVSATVVGGRLALCDAFATALAVGGTSVLYLLEQMDDMDGFFISPSGSMFTTTGMVFSDSPDTDI
jgi:thiamine biosynthesis lipoprotein